MTNKQFSKILLVLFGLGFIFHGFGQTYNYQNGFSASGGLSYISHFNADFKPFSPKGIAEKWSFSYELGYLNTKLISDNVAFTYGLSAMALRHSFSTEILNYVPKEDVKTNYYFNKTSQVIDRYHVGISFRWSFFLNQGINRFFIGPGATLSIPIFHVAKIEGSTSISDSISITDRYFTEKGPYLFIPLEAAGGYQREFADCSLFRVEGFFQWRAQGLIQKSDDKWLEHYFGLRISFFY